MFPTFAVVFGCGLVCYGLLQVADAIRDFKVEHRLPHKLIVEKSRDGSEFTIRIPIQ